MQPEQQKISWQRGLGLGSAGGIVPDVFQLVEHVLGRIVYVYLDGGGVEVLHGELFGEGANEQGLNGVYGGDFVREQGPLGLVAVLKKYQSCKKNNPR